MNLIYGSTAIKHHFPDFREPRDIDIISRLPIKSTESLQYYWVDAFEYLEENNKGSHYVDSDLLYTIKVSHASWDINWVKTMKDIEFLKSKGSTLDKDFYNILYSDWEEIHRKKKVKMNVKNEDFFTKTITRKYNHESLHEIFKFYKRPLNEKIRKDLNSPLCSEALWDKLNFEDKIKTALEEIFVLSTERYILVESPVPNKIARIKTLKQMITSSTSGWFNLFLIIHFDSLRTHSQTYFENKLKQIKG